MRAISLLVTSDAFSHLRRLRRWLVLPILAAVAAATLVVPAAASAAPTPCADLQITSVTFSPVEPVQGQPATVAVGIINAGTCAAGGFVTQFHQTTTSGAVASGSITGLGAGASTTLDLPYVFPKAGNYETEVVVDSGNSVPETNESNNIAIAPVTVLPPGINLVIDSFTVAPVVADPTNAVVSGRPATATIVVQNTGNVPAGTFEVQWKPTAISAPLTATVAGLAAGASTTVTLTFTYPSAGTFTGIATVDPTNLVKETDEKDNTATLSTVVEPPLPNLLIPTDGIAVTPAPAGGTTTVVVTIENNGNSDAGAFEVRWQPGGGLAAQSQEVAGLAEGATTTVTFDTVYPKAGSYTGTATADSTNAVKEVSETDNTATTSITIAAATVDLAVTGVTSSPAEPTQEVAASISVTVTNLGNTPSGSYTVSWNPDSLGVIVPGNQTLSTTITTPLAPGTSATETFSFAYPVAGNFRSVAQVTSIGPTDVNPSNNQAILNLTVAAAQIDLQFSSPSIAFSPSTLVSGQTETATVNVVNNGPIAAGAFAVSLQTQTNGATQEQFVKGLNVGQSITLTFKVKYFLPGTYTVTAKVDPANQVVKSPTALANDVITQSVTVIAQKATVMATLSSLDVLSAGTSSWSPIVFGVYDPTASCGVSILGKTITIKKFNCAQGSASGVTTGSTVSTNLSVNVTLTQGAPLVAATFAAAEESVCVLKIVVCLKHINLPVIRGLAPSFGFQPQYVADPNPVTGVACLEDNFKTLENGGHCFTANFNTTVTSANYPVSQTVSAAARKAATSERAYLKRSIDRAARQVAAAARVVAQRQAGGRDSAD